MITYTLPYYEDLTREFSDAFSHWVAMVTRSAGLLAQIETHAIHEGFSATFVGMDGIERTTEINTAEASTTISKGEAEQINLDHVFRAIHGLAEQFRREQSRHLFEVLEAASSETGNVVDGKGRPLTHDLVLEALEKMQHEFDEAGQPTMSIVVHPDMAPRLAQMEREYQADPELRKKHAELMARKLDEFRSREMDRNLAG